MPIAINLTLDPDSANHVERLYALLGTLNVPDQDLVTQYGPCVTILVLGDKISPATVARTLELHIGGLEALAITFTEPCIIQGTPPTLSLRVGPTDPLLALHNALFSEFVEGEVHLHYRPAYWQPHLKLCNVRDDHASADRLVAKVAAAWRTQGGVVDGLEVIQYPPAQSTWQARLKHPAPHPPG